MSPTEYLHFDAVWLFSVAGNASIYSLDSQMHHNFTHIIDTDALKAELFNSDFDGLSGKISFDNETNSVVRNIRIEQLSKMKLSTIAIYQYEIETIEPGVFISSSEIQIHKVIVSSVSAPVF